MTTAQRLVGCLLASAMIFGAGSSASAVELLNAGGFEPSGSLGGEVPFWSLVEVISGTTTSRGAAALAGFADNPLDPMNENPDDRGLWLQAFNGDPDPGLVDAFLTQTVAGVAGETYTFSGEAAFETNYSGGVAFLDPLSPWGAIESPTKTEFELAFLDSNGDVIGSPMVQDLATEVFNGFGYTSVTPLSGVAPAGTASVRVQARATMMADAGLNPQSAFLDNFSLTAGSAPSTELLANPNLNILPPTLEDLLVDEGWEFVEDPDTSTDMIRIQGFANNPATGGDNGVWISPFLASAQGGSAQVRQTVEGAAGTEYSFSASTRWEVNFTADSGAGENEALLELAFLDSNGDVIDSTTLDLRSAGQTADNNWHTYSVTGTAPEGTTDVRVAGIINNLTNNTVNGANQSAFWDDFSLMEVDAGIPGDFDGDGDVDIIDFGTFADNFGMTGLPLDPATDGDFEPDGDVDIIDFGVFADNFGTGVSAVSVPEPGSALLVIASLSLAAVWRRG